MSGKLDEEDVDRAIHAARKLIEVAGSEALSLAEEFLAKSHAAGDKEQQAAWRLIIKAVEALTEGPPPGQVVH